jgi:hypothetical protein
MSLPTHRERQFMQHLRGGGWVKASAAPAGELLIKNLLEHRHDAAALPRDIQEQILR